ncbi:unnamed protein product [Caenorhabditis angaria]|uniref:F-box domain-containing protein n=1 Tax=Caenorhabditis angaria TaxID=860376 RepID=A0A9P1I5X2_9PELO|nr:unnamed protein product [Caenorhabditis angaria]
MSKPKKARLEDGNVSLEENAPKTTGWFDIPYEMRKIVIDEMDTKTRCRFTICSNKCEEEAKMSKKYLQSLKIGRGIHPELYIGHDASGYHYCLEFIDISDLTEVKSFVVYKTTQYDENSYSDKTVMKWMKIIENEKAEDVRMRYLNEILEKYQKTIVSFALEDEDFPKRGFNLKMLENLSDIEDKTDKDLVGNGLFDASQIIGCWQLRAENTKLTYQQVLELDPWFGTIRCDEFNQSKLLEYIDLFRQGKIRQSLGVLTVYTRNLSDRIDIDEIAEFVGCTDVDIEHFGWTQFFVRMNLANRKVLVEFNFYHDHFSIDPYP